jgi:Predicted membrane protein
MKRLLTTACSETSFNLAALLLRVTFGSMMFLNHGLAKMMKFRSMQDSFSDPFNIGPMASLLLVIFAEVFCAIFVVLGLFTRVAAIPLIITMAVVVFMINKNQPFSKLELPTLFLGAFIAILFMGSGKYSVDRAIGK